MANVVTLTFAGDSAAATKAMSNVSRSSEDMGDAVRRSGESFDAAAERSDALDTRAMGFRDTLTGIQDGAAGVKRAASGDWGFETLLLLGTGIGDLASGLTNFLIPAVKGARTAQLGLNTAFLTSPITWIIVGIVALVATFVILWNKSSAFRDFWINMWAGIRKAATAAWSGIKTAANSTWEFLKKIPGWTASAFKSVANAISAPYRAAFNLIARAWNSTVGSLSWTVPDWIPGIGGNSISVPNLPTFHAGGRVPGAPGEYTTILAMAGETVSATGSTGSSGDNGAWVPVDMGRLGDALVELIAQTIGGRKGGRVTALGVRVIGGAIRT